MAKFKEKIKARELRRKGESMKEIAKKLKVSKGTVSIWCRDIKLTKKQAKRLKEKMIKAGHKGRIKGAKIQRERHLRKVKELKKQGIERVNKLNKRDLLIAGIALYWGEGDRKDNMIRFGNSDPQMIKFMLNWFEKNWKVGKDRIKLHIGINEIHKGRLEEVEKYWSKVTNIPRNQFGKTVLIKAKNKKNYKNFNNHYGTISIRLRKSSTLKYQMDGMIESMRNYIK
jgi:transcriptional regulator with XRE-family HTH domain